MVQYQISYSFTLARKDYFHMGDSGSVHKTFGHKIKGEVNPSYMIVKSEIFVT